MAEAGYYTIGGDLATRTGKAQCPLGHYCDGDGLKTPCPAGKYGDTKGLSTW